MEFHPRITFLGQDYILVGGHAITTETAYLKGEATFAHLCDDGQIRRFGQVIGTAQDIVYSGVSVDLEPEPAEFFRGLFGGTWRRIPKNAGILPGQNGNSQPD